MQQEFVQIGEVSVPVIIDEGIRYYPISYITTKVLLRSGKNSLFTKSNREQFETYLKKLVVVYGETNIQRSNCISEEGLKILLSKTQQSRLSIEQRSSQNKLHEYLGLKLLTERELIMGDLSDELLNEHDLYTQDLIRQFQNQDARYQLCSKCEKYYLLVSEFFVNTHKGLSKICRSCTGKELKSMHDEDKLMVINDAGDNGYINLINGNVTAVFESYLNGKIERLPQTFQNKRDLAKIVKHIYQNYKIQLNDIKLSYFKTKYKLTMLGSYFTTNEIHDILFGSHAKLYPWKYPAYQIGRHVSNEYGKLLFSNYIIDMGITVDDIFNFKYGEICTKARIKVQDLLRLVVEYYDYKYPGYMFKIAGVNYYKDEENVLFDLRYLIEWDIKIPVSKIPLYLTKNTLQQKCRPLYTHIITNKNKTLYEWVDLLYPNKFIQADFEMNVYRNEFDSDTERFIHEILTEMFDNVLYNQKHTNRTITIDGMIPDWLVFTSNGVWIVEYFGLYVERQKDNPRVRGYIEKTHRKIERYKQVSGYNFVYLYPEDIEDDYFGCREKLSKIGMNSIVSRD